MSTILSGKVILVTGGAKRVGAEIVRRVHGAGAAVMFHYRSAQSHADALVAELNGVRARSACAVRADLLDADRVPDLVEAAVEHFGRLDGLVNNASSFYSTPLGAIEERHWHDLVGTNFKAPLLLAQAAASPLRASCGAIVNIVDIHAERPLRGFPLYCAAKAALIGLTRALAVELAPEVRVNAVAPGPIQWPEDGTFDAAEREAIVSHTLLQRVGEPADIARTVLFLLGEAPYVTGQVLTVDGGRSVRL
jgi:pteridine reductase